MPANSVLARPLFSGAFGQDLSQSEVTVTSAVTNAERSIAVLPAPGHFASLRLTNETGDGESEMLGGGVSETISCSLRLEACANCVIGMELEPVANRFSESQAVKVSFYICFFEAIIDQFLCWKILNLFSPSAIKMR